MASERDVTERDRAYMSAHAGKGRKWTKQRAAACARASQTIGLPTARVNPAPTSASGGIDRHLRSTIGTCLQHRATMAEPAERWPARPEWPRPDARLHGAGHNAFEKTFDFRLHNGKGGPARDVPTHNAHKRLSGGSATHTLTAHGLLPGGDASTRTLHAAMPGHGRATPDAAPTPEVDDALIAVCLGARRAEPPFQLGWTMPKQHARPVVDAVAKEEWILHTGSYEPITLYALHQAKVNRWRAEAAAKPKVAAVVMPPLQPLPKPKWQQYAEVRAAIAAARSARSAAPSTPRPLPSALPAVARKPSRACALAVSRTLCSIQRISHAARSAVHPFPLLRVPRPMCGLRAAARAAQGLDGARVRLDTQKRVEAASARRQRGAARDGRREGQRQCERLERVPIVLTPPAHCSECPCQSVQK